MTTHLSGFRSPGGEEKQGSQTAAADKELELCGEAGSHSVPRLAPGCLCLSSQENRAV